MTATNGELCAVMIIFFCSVANNSTAIGDILPAVSGDIGLVDEENRAVEFNLDRYYLGKSFYLVSVGLTVQLAVFWVLH